MKKFVFTSLTIPEVILIEPFVFEDNRGFFTEIYNEKEFGEMDIHEHFVQDNLSFSQKNVIRGLHFSKSPKETVKLVRCVYGKILDVAVDIRPSSRTFGQWVGEILTGENRKMLFVPKGFAHGFSVLSENALVSYKVTDYYYPEYDAGVSFSDPDLAIDWKVERPVLSEKDKKLPFLKNL